MEEQIDFSKPQRQPIQAIVQALLKSFASALKSIWPFALAYIFNLKSQDNPRKNTVWLILMLGLSAFIVGYTLIEFFYLRFMIRDKELVIKKGFFIKRELVIPFEKIQAIHLDRDWLQRLLGIAKVSIDTPGTTHTEERFFLANSMAKALRDAILNQPISHTVSESAEEAHLPVINLSGKDLFKLGISANFLKAMLVLLGFAIARADDLSGITGKTSWDWVEWIEEKTAGGTVLLIASGITIILVVSILISFGLVILKYGNFSMLQTTKGFHIRSGLINVREKLVPFKKVQFISWEANWIRRHIPYYLFHFHIIGDHEISDKWRIAVPVTRPAFFPLLFQHYHPELPKGTPFLTMSGAYVGRNILYAAVFSIAAILISWLLGWEQALWLGVIFPLWVIRSIIHRKNFKAAISTEAIQINHSIFSKSHSLLRWDKVVSVLVKQNIFQRHRRLATLVLFTGGGKVELPYIQLSDANRLRDYALYKVED